MYKAGISVRRLAETTVIPAPLPRLEAGAASDGNVLLSRVIAWGLLSGGKTDLDYRGQDTQRVAAPMRPISRWTPRQLSSHRSGGTAYGPAQADPLCPPGQPLTPGPGAGTTTCHPLSTVRRRFLLFVWWHTAMRPVGHTQGASSAAGRSRTARGRPWRFERRQDGGARLSALRGTDRPLREPPAVPPPGNHTSLPYGLATPYEYTLRTNTPLTSPPPDTSLPSGHTTTPQRS